MSPSNRRHRAAPPARTMGRPGFSLVEVIVAMMLLTTVVLALGSFTMKLARANGQAHLVIAANEIASQRLDEARQQPTYSSISLLAESTSVTYDFLKFGRQTVVQRIGGAPTDSVDYRLITVIVSHPSMTKAVSKTTAIAAF